MQCSLECLCISPISAPSQVQKVLINFYANQDMCSRVQLQMILEDLNSLQLESQRVSCTIWTGNVQVQGWTLKFSSHNKKQQKAVAQSSSFHRSRHAYII